MNPIDSFISVFAPHSCVGCGREGAIYCRECQDNMDVLPSICYLCGKATRYFMPCDDCKTRHRPVHVWMVAPYKDVPKDLIRTYKFDEKRAAALPLARFIAATLPHFSEDPIVSFVPTATEHRRTRGFDHAELLAREVARLRGWRYMRSLHRVAQIRQLGATREQRKSQLAGAFRPNNQLLMRDKHVLLIDDVVTTGATINECAKVLHNAGVKQVDAAVFARTMEK